MKTTQTFETTVKKDISLNDGVKVLKGETVKVNEVEGHFYLHYNQAIHHIEKEYINAE